MLKSGTNRAGTCAQFISLVAVIFAVLLCFVCIVRYWGEGYCNISKSKGGSKENICLIMLGSVLRSPNGNGGKCISDLL